MVINDLEGSGASPKGATVAFVPDGIEPQERLDQRLQSTSGALVLVAGLGRCGSSLLMQMLDAGGVPCAGTFPAYEDEAVADLLKKDTPDTYSGKAIKLVDPWRWRIPITSASKVIFCTRDETQQARSQIKFPLLLMGHFHEALHPSATQVRKMREILRRDERRSRSHLSRAGASIVVRYEDVLSNPTKQAERIANFIGTGDVAAMSRAPLPRGASCYPGLFEQVFFKDEVA